MQGFAKAIVEKETGRILGFHIIGPDASILIQEVVNAFTQKGRLSVDHGCHAYFPVIV